MRNILTLRKDLTTKEQIEDAHVDNLEWALANTELGGGDHDEVLHFSLSSVIVYELTFYLFTPA